MLSKNPLLPLVLTGASFLFFTPPISARPITEQQIALIETLLFQGRYLQSERQLSSLLDKNPHDFRLLSLQAQLKINQGLLDEAISLYQSLNFSSAVPFEQLVTLNNFHYALNYKEKSLTEQLLYLQREQSSYLPQVQQQLTNIQQQRRSIEQDALLLASSLPPSSSVAQAYFNARQWEQAITTLEFLEVSERVPILTQVALQARNPHILTPLLPHTQGHDQLQLLTVLAQLDPKYLQDAITLALEQANDEYLFQLFHLQAQQGIYPQRSLHAAISSLSRLRSALASPSPAVKFFFREKVIPVYRDYLTLLLKNPTQKNLREARAIFDRLQIAQVENLLNQLCLVPENTTIEETLQTIKGAVVHLIVLENNFHVLLSLPSGEIKHHQIEISQTNLEAKVIEWRKKLTDPSDTLYGFTSSEFYDLIIRPFDKDLNDIEQLIFVTDGIFRNVPLQAFFDSLSEEFLIEQFQVSNLLILEFLQPIPRESNQLIAYGISEPVPSFNSPLPFVELELEAIDSIIPQSSIKLNQSFSRDNLRRDLMLTQPQILHIASHAQFTGDPKTSFVVTYYNTLNLFELEEILDLGNHLRLLVLSACETAQGNDLATLGLAGVAAQAQIPQTVATLWKANDQDTAELMQSFYQHLSQGLTTTEALQQAQIESIYRKEHPYSWSLLLLFGF